MVAGFALLFVALFSPVLFSGRLLGTTDAVIYYYPAWATRAFGWTSLLYSGYPVGGDPQTMFWYPLSWLSHGLFGGSGIGWNVFILSAYVAGASFCYGYALRLTSSRLASAIAGIGYGMSGFAIAHLDHASIIHTLAWVPLVLWALEAQRDSSAGKWLFATAFGVANALLAGHPQVFVYAMLLAGAYGLVRARGARSGAVRYGLQSGLGVACGVGLAAVMWVPMLELALASLRAAMSRADFFQYAVEWAQLPQLLLPHVFGGALGLTLTAPAVPALPFFGPGIPGEVSGFTGLLPVMLAGMACFVARQRFEVTLVRFWFGVAVVSLLLALGDNALVSEPLLYLPGYNRFRIPTRHLFELSLAVSVLAAMGVAALEQQSRKRRVRTVGWGLASVGGAALLSAVVAAAVLQSGAFAEEMYRAGVEVDEAHPLRNAALGVQGLAFVVAAAAVFTWARSAPGRVRKVASCALVAAVALDLASYARFAGWRMSADPGESFAMPRVLEPLQAELAESGQRIAPLTFDAPATGAPPNRSQLWGIPSVLGYGPLPTADYANLLGLSAAHFRGPEELGRVLGADDRTLDILATRYVLVPDDTRASDTRTRRAAYLRPTREAPPQWASVREFLDRSRRWNRLPGLPGTAIYENKRAAPRAWVVGRVEIAEEDAITETILSGRLASGARFDPLSVALVEGPFSRAPALTPSPGSGCARDCGDAEIVRIEDREVVVRARAASDAFLVLSDAYYPGWRAHLDGERVEIYRTDACLRGVRLPPGDHEIRFTFRSASFEAGAGLSLGSLVLLAALSFLRRPRGGGR